MISSGSDGIADEIARTDERRGLRHRRPRCLDDAVARRSFGVRELERGGDGGLLLGVRRRRGSRRCGRAPGEHGARDLVHRVACVLHRRVGAATDLGARERREERKGQLLVVELGADAELTARRGLELRLEPLLVRLHGGARALDRAPESRLVRLGQRAELQHDQLIDQREHTGALLHGGFGMDRRHARRIQVGAHLLEQLRELLETRGRRRQPLRQRRIVAREQAVQRLAGELRVDQRIPGPVAQALVAPDLVAQLVVEHGRIDLIRARESAAIERRELGQQSACPGDGAPASRRTHVLELRVEPVITELRGGYGRVAAELLHVARGDGLEARIGLRDRCCRGLGIGGEDKCQD